MAVLLNNGALFLHIPKTGGTWVTRVLREAGLMRCSIGHRHANLDHLLAPSARNLGKRLEWQWKRTLFLRTRPRPFTFCFVRHPLRWYESFYLYKSQPGIAWERDGDEWDVQRWHPNALLNGLGEGRDFNEFVSAVLDRHPGYVSALFDHFTFRPVDFIGKQENLRDDLAAVLERLDCAFDPDLVHKKKRINTSGETPQRPRWDATVRERALRLERPALERFGYSLE